MDPLASLPAELVLKIMECLPFRSIVAAQRISKAWLHFIRSEPSLWHHLDFTQARRDASAAIIDTAIQVAAESVNAITLYGDRMLAHGMDEAFEKLAKACPLEKVALMQTGVLDEDRRLVLTLRNLRGLHELRMMAYNSHGVTHRSLMVEPHINTLEILDLDGYVIRSDHCLATSVFPRVHTLRIAAKGQQGSGVAGLSGPGLHERFPMLERLEISNICRRRKPSDFAACARLKSLVLRRDDLSIQDLRLPASLRTLNLEGQQPRLDAENNESTQFYLPRLEHLTLSLPGNLINTFRHFLKPENDTEPQITSGLTHLILSHLDALTWSGLLAPPFSHPRLQQLECLRIHDTATLDDTGARSIIDQLKHLRWLDICRSSITDAGVRYIVKHSGVRTLHLRGCQNVSEEVVEWARDQDMKIVR